MKLVTRTSVLAVGLGVLAFVPTAGAWESDVHFGLTKWLAVQAGFTEEQAAWIADGNVGMDRSPVTSAVGITIYSACVANDEGGARRVHDYHFPSAQNVRKAPDVRNVDAGKVYKGGNPEEAPRITDYKSDDQLKHLGEYLHVFQDSWSHKGQPDVAPGCLSDLAWGHPLKRGGWSCHLADHTYAWVKDDVLPMAFATYQILVDRKPGSATDWRLLEPLVLEFATAQSKWAKDDWFTKRKDDQRVKRVDFKDTEFLQEISLPDCDGKGPCPGRYDYQKLIKDWPEVFRRSRESLSGRDRPSVPAELLKLFNGVADGLIKQSGDVLSQYVDKGPAIATLSRAFRIVKECPALYDKTMPNMVRAGFAQAFGARQPKEFCELVAKSDQKQLSCDEVMQVLQSADPAPVGASIEEMAPIVKRETGLDSYILEASFDPLSKIAVAFVRFVHLPRDVLMLTAQQRPDGPKITGIVWVPDL